MLMHENPCLIPILNVLKSNRFVLSQTKLSINGVNCIQKIVMSPPEVERVEVGEGRGESFSSKSC